MTYVPIFIPQQIEDQVPVQGNCPYTVKNPSGQWQCVQTQADADSITNETNRQDGMTFAYLMIGFAIFVLLVLYLAKKASEI